MLAKPPTCSVGRTSRLGLVVVASIVLVDVARAGLPQAETVVGRSVTANRNERMRELGSDGALWSHLEP